MKIELIRQRVANITLPIPTSRLNMNIVEYKLYLFICAYLFRPFVHMAYLKENKIMIL